MNKEDEEKNKLFLKALKEKQERDKESLKKFESDIEALGIVRKNNNGTLSKKSINGDYGEWYCSSEYGGERVQQGEEGYDIDNIGEKEEIKTSINDHFHLQEKKQLESRCADTWFFVFLYPTVKKDGRYIKRVIKVSYENMMSLVKNGLLGQNKHGTHYAFRYSKYEKSPEDFGIEVLEEYIC